jgi:hypothetical protein
MIMIDLPIGQGYHPFQILFARMAITVVCASVYMWRTKTEHFPLGLREVRSLLVARGLTGFFGVFGMYCKCSSHVVSTQDATYCIRAQAVLSAEARGHRSACRGCSGWLPTVLHYPLRIKRGAKNTRFSSLPPTCRCHRYYM